MHQGENCIRPRLGDGQDRRDPGQAHDQGFGNIVAARNRASQALGWPKDLSRQPAAASLISGLCACWSKGDCSMLTYWTARRPALRNRWTALAASTMRSAGARRMAAWQDCAT